jgi:hypothetical protein
VQAKICHTCPDWSWGPPSLLYNVYWLSFSGVNLPGHSINHPPLSSTKVKERVEQYSYSPSGSLWPFEWPDLPHFLPCNCCLHVKSLTLYQCIIFVLYHMGNIMTFFNFLVVDILASQGPGGR